MITKELEQLRKEEKFEQSSKPALCWAIASFSAIIGIFVIIVATTP